MKMKERETTERDRERENREEGNEKWGCKWLQDKIIESRKLSEKRKEKSNVWKNVMDRDKQSVKHHLHN